MRNLISLRHRELGNRLTTYQPLPAAPGCWAYRTGDMIVLADFTDEPQPATETGRLLHASSGDPVPTGQDASGGVHQLDLGVV